MRIPARKARPAGDSAGRPHVPGASEGSVLNGMRSRVVGLLLAGLVAVNHSVHAVQLDESLVKGAMLVNLGLFVEWPEHSSEPFVMAVAADEAFVDTVIRLVRGRRLNGREVQVRRLSGSESDCACHVLFVGLPEDGRSARLLQSARGKPVLTIGETTSFLRGGGVVRIFRDDDRLRLQINTKAADSAGLRISSRLLQLAVPTP